ncbi:16S rRNA (cytosine(967)-C(5))-methyltransferase RsmB [Paenibacillus sp. 1P07SE]|uniref:16S rRNA (cytosine(967)-C(5))-methyltransferase RsmB n=1 Tax=Paenibacillus sp. 1P07SE TaxID=3132209 RepID=UPI0039A42327
MTDKRRYAVTARSVALDTLVKVTGGQAYSNLQLNRALQAAELSRADAGLATELVYGTIQRLNTLDHVLQRFVTKGLHKLDPWVLQLLRMSAYQLIYLTRVPPHAAVHEAVELAKQRGHRGISGMVNGVLRSLQRSPDKLSLPAGLPPDERISLVHSHPLWLTRRWIAAFGEETTEAMCRANNEPPHASIRVNRQRKTREEVLALLAEEGYEAAPSPLAEDGIVVSQGGNLADTIGYRNGWWTVQDESSMLVAEAAAPRSGMQVLDCCAAPGGKTTHLAERMGDAGVVRANDLHPHKRQLIEAQAERLGLHSILAMTGDAAQLGEQLEAASLDLILLDAPCTGLGVIRRKPEIKWHKSEADIDSVAEVQARLLEAAVPLLRPGGRLIYSTCTVDHTENAGQVDRFLQAHPEFALDPGWPQPLLERLRSGGVLGETFDGRVQLLPQHFGTDGFFIAALRKQA